MQFKDLAMGERFYYVNPMVKDYEQLFEKVGVLTIRAKRYYGFLPDQFEWIVYPAKLGDDLEIGTAEVISVEDKLRSV